MPGRAATAPGRGSEPAGPGPAGAAAQRLLLRVAPSQDGAVPAAVPDVPSACALRASLRAIGQRYGDGTRQWVATQLEYDEAQDDCIESAPRLDGRRFALVRCGRCQRPVLSEPIQPRSSGRSSNSVFSTTVLVVRATPSMALIW